MSHDVDHRGIWQALVADGRPVLTLVGCCLILSGGFALFVASMGQFLPHDVAFLGMTEKDLCAINECRIVHFMEHDRASFGGVLIAIGLLYLWLAEFPLRAGHAWAWWTLVASGVVGFASFLCYLGYGYLDTWHGIATLALLPWYLLGMFQSGRRLPSLAVNLRAPTARRQWTSAAALGRWSLLAMSLGIVGAGLTIQTVGMTSVFVPQDLDYMGLTVARLQEINPRLVPLIAHDRAGFGGGLASGGIVLFLMNWFARPSRSLWQIQALAAGIGFTCAIGVHPAIGYTNFLHLLPAYTGAALLLIGLTLTRRACFMTEQAISPISPGKAPEVVA
ncbi:MAG: hypothetical protein SGJ19_16840 [Planctomycetia bacterium]|nr:hypothetical protein [Planctomycetia bacterium]